MKNKGKKYEFPILNIMKQQFEKATCLLNIILACIFHLLLNNKNILIFFPIFTIVHTYYKKDQIDSLSSSSIDNSVIWIYNDIKQIYIQG